MDFGDETTETLPTPIVDHEYRAVGNYTVTLIVTDDEGLTDSAQAVVRVIYYPKANFTYTPARPLVDETVTFNASLSELNGGSIVSYEWDFGDGTTGSGMIVNHTYTSHGTYEVTLTVIDSEELSDTYTSSIRILITPVANFTFSPKYPVVNETIIFNATYSFDFDGSIVSYLWNFSDGNITEVFKSVVNHTYAEASTYKVTLTVTDDDGLTDTFEQLISVYTSVPLHDVAVVEVNLTSTWAYRGNIVNITITVANLGESIEKFNVTIYYNETEIEI